MSVARECFPVKCGAECKGLIFAYSLNPAGIAEREYKWYGSKKAKVMGEEAKQMEE